MHSCWRIMRLLLIVGMIPAILAAGLPMPLCACGVETASAGCACCQSDDSSNCCASSTGCACCDQAIASSCCDPSHDSEEQNSETGSTIACHCGGSIPAPTAPAPVSVEFPLSAGLFAVSLDAVAPAPVVSRSMMQIDRASLPPADLSTTLCTLLI